MCLEEKTPHRPYKERGDASTPCFIQQRQRSSFSIIDCCAGAVPASQTHLRLSQTPLSTFYFPLAFFKLPSPAPRLAVASGRGAAPARRLPLSRPNTRLSSRPPTVMDDDHGPSAPQGVRRARPPSQHALRRTVGRRVGRRAHTRHPHYPSTNPTPKPGPSRAAVAGAQRACAEPPGGRGPASSGE